MLSVIWKAKMKVLVAQLCPILCNPMDCSPPVSSLGGVSFSMIQPQAPWQLTVAVTAIWKARTRNGKENGIISGSKPYSYSGIILEYSSHCFWVHLFYFNPPIYLVSPHKLGWEVVLWTRFPFPHSLYIEYSACYSSVSIGFIIGYMNMIRKRTSLAKTGDLSPG